MDLSQITMSQTASTNQFTYDRSEQDKVILRAERRRRRLQALWLGTLATRIKFSAATRRLLRETAQMTARPHVAK